jgi:hypothetical protein
MELSKPRVRLKVRDSTGAIAKAEVDHVSYFNFTAALRWHFRISGCHPKQPSREGCSVMLFS